MRAVDCTYSRVMVDSLRTNVPWRLPAACVGPTQHTAAIRPDAWRRSYETMVSVSTNRYQLNRWQHPWREKFSRQPSWVLWTKMHRNLFVTLSSWSIGAATRLPYHEC